MLKHPCRVRGQLSGVHSLLPPPSLAVKEPSLHWGLYPSLVFVELYGVSADSMTSTVSIQRRQENMVQHHSVAGVGSNFRQLILSRIQFGRKYGDN